VFKELGSRSYGRAMLVAAALVVTLLSSSQTRAAEEIVGEVIIEATGLRPQVLRTEPEHKVQFVNRSGKPIHIQFLMGDGEQHHIFQVPDRIWAIFHQIGWHRYVVHFLEHETQKLEGAVEVVGDPYGGPDPRVCSGITVQGACIER
jgi:hypothetical protein